MNSNARTLARAIAFSFTVSLLWISSAALAGITLGSPFQDHMVLQRQMKVPVWGTASPGENVTVTFAGQTKTAAADAAGRWSAALDPLEASSTAADLTVSGSSIVTVKDILIGEVWLASGQSNMTYWFVPKDYPEELKIDHPLIREFNAAFVGSLKPMETVQGSWDVCTAQTLGQTKFSAVAYFFARELQQKLNVPVGILHSSYGGTQGESWVSREALDANPILKDFAEDQIAAMQSRAADDKAFSAKLSAWQAANGATDSSDDRLDQGWDKVDASPQGWLPITIPANFQQLGMKSGGIVWFRKDVDIPADATGKPLVLHFGWTDDAVQAYWNRTVIPDAHPFYHRNADFHVPAELVKQGPTTVAFRVESMTTEGHLWRTSAELGLATKDDGSANQWMYQIQKRFPELTPEARASLPKAPQAEIQNTASCLFNAKIHPLIPYAIRGVIWYQGESNGNRPETYRTLLTTLIQDWRARWGEGSFPFYIVQLANNGRASTQPVDEPWSGVREAQLQVSKEVPNSGLAVAIDIGDAKTIHPPDKFDVGHRLALSALAKTYGMDLEYAGPMYESMAIEGHAIRVKFSHVGAGLVAKGGPLQQFTIAGDDGQFVTAQAVIDGDTVVVWSPMVEKPWAVRYAWATNPAGCNLYNAAGLPSSPFRTDPPQNAGKVLPLKNGSFLVPSIAPAPYQFGIRPEGWTFAGSDSGLSARVDGGVGQSLFWNVPHGSVRQEIPTTEYAVTGTGERYQLQFRCGGQGAGVFTFSPRILIGGKPAATWATTFDHPTGASIRRLFYTATPADKGQAIGVEFAVEQTGDKFVQPMLQEVVLSVAPPAPGTAP